jgi:hypothetical protein
MVVREEVRRDFGRKVRVRGVVSSSLRILVKVERRMGCDRAALSDGWDLHLTGSQ